MNKSLFPWRTAFLGVSLIGALLTLPQISAGAQRPLGTSEVASGLDESQTSELQREVQDKLSKPQFKDVQARLDRNGITTLTGTVSLYEYKADAEKRAHKAKGVIAVRNLIEVSAPNVSDQELTAKLRDKLAYDRVGYGNLFNSITLSVENGVVTLGGHARTDVDKDSAVALMSTYPGVKDVVSDIEVDPVSFMDDETRLAVARAIYGYSMLSKYGMDPAKPIRISVQNGIVELYGTVDSKMDKQLAYMRARQVPNVFEVKDFLLVANPPKATKKR